MKVTTNIPYKYEDSFDRIQEILDSSETFEQVDSVPNSDSLTYNNGYYFRCYSIFIDIRESSKLPERYQKRTLAKIYRAYISEIVALFQSKENCKDLHRSCRNCIELGRNFSRRRRDLLGRNAQLDGNARASRNGE